MSRVQRPISIPEPTNDVDALWRTTQVLKEAVEVIQGIRGNREYALKCDLDDLNTEVTNVSVTAGGSTGVDTLFDLIDTDISAQTQYDLLFNADGTEWQTTIGNLSWVPGDSSLRLANEYSISWEPTGGGGGTDLLELRSNNSFYVGSSIYPLELRGSLIGLQNNIGINWDDTSGANVELAIFTDGTVPVGGGGGGSFCYGVDLASDPLWNDVTCLIPWEGTDGAQTATDESTVGATVTFNGNAQIDTATAACGVGSLLLPGGTGDYVQLPADNTSYEMSGEVGTLRDTCIEFFVMWNGTDQGVAKTGPLFQYAGDAATSKANYTCVITSSEKVQFKTAQIQFVDATGFDTHVVTGTTTLVQDQWYHIAVVYDESIGSGGGLYLYVDGTLEDSDTTTGNPPGTANTDLPLRFGNTVGSSAYCDHSQIDGFRITQNQLRYTGNFTPPTTLSAPEFVLGDPLFPTVIEGTSVNVTAAATDIDGTLNVDGISDFNADVDINDGTLRIWDVTATDNAAFSHNGTDFSTVFTTTADWNISGLTSTFQVDAPATVINANTQTFADSAGNTFFFFDHDGGPASSSRMQLDIPLALQNGITNRPVMYMQEIPAAVTDFAAFGQWWVRNDIANTPMFTDDAGVDGQLARLEFDETVTGDWSFSDQLTIINGIDTALFRHDGTDFLMQGANTGAFRIQPLSGEESIVANANGSVDLYHDNALVANTTSDGFEITSADAILKFVETGGLADRQKTRWRQNFGSMSLQSLTDDELTAYDIVVYVLTTGGVPERQEFWNGLITRIYDSSNTDYFDIFNNGVDAVIEAQVGMSDIDLIDWNALRLRDGAALIINDSLDTSAATFSHDGTDFNTVFGITTDWNITGANVIFDQPTTVDQLLITTNLSGTELDIEIGGTGNIGAETNLNFFCDVDNNSTAATFNWYTNAYGVTAGTLLATLTDDGDFSTISSVNAPLIEAHKSGGTSGDVLHLRDSTDAEDLVWHYDGVDWVLRSELAGAGNRYMWLDASLGRVHLYHGDNLRFNTLGNGNVVIRSDGNTDAEVRAIQFQHSDATLRGRFGHITTNSTMYWRNQIHGGTNRIEAENTASGTVVLAFSQDPDGLTIVRGATDLQLDVSNNETAIYCNANGSVDLYYDDVIQAQTQDGGFKVNRFFQNRTATTAQLNDSANSVNTSNGKIQGAQVYNTTTGQPVWADGNGNTSTWSDATGTVAHTPTP